MNRNLIPEIDVDLLEELDARLVPVQAGDELLLARAKATIMRTIAQDRAPLYRTVRASDREGWQKVCPGLERKVLWDSQGARSVMLRVAPGTTVPAHVHGMDEECVVLQGTIRIGELELHAGDYHVGRRGTSHELAATDTGAVVYLRGAMDEV
ncbi:cupin domain-containing protein [Caenimonas aquaedulcis]|uniref:Cupin domain-containing protein n=1 Tax=Caenimonas aquaedulcis TaxID=2793270 RepID=A0A931MJE0_9BURK|nr:cupin domain-containing protein [Caenimonas aquaedulcis]MBG9390693.1 cupin domain-containing protein [Caenimonas aquaedulcis]